MLSKSSKYAPIGYPHSSLYASKFLSEDWTIGTVSAKGPLTTRKMKFTNYVKEMQWECSYFPSVYIPFLSFCVCNEVVDSFVVVLFTSLSSFFAKSWPL